MRISYNNLCRFVQESNMIEGIIRQPYTTEIKSLMDFLTTPYTVHHLTVFVQSFDPYIMLRNQVGINVKVGRNTQPPPGGPEILHRLEILLDSIYDMTPHEFHLAYERLHPFTDGNGRSGRALWLKRSLELETYRPDISFLHQWYYSCF